MEEVEELNTNQGGCAIIENVVGLKKLSEEADLARQKHAEERDQLNVRVETLQRQLAELIEAKVGLEKEKKLLLAGGTADASQCSTPGASQGNCSTPPQPNFKWMSRCEASRSEVSQADVKV
ncbi:hypothetical protein DUNSADRAFT_9042 [Dunaliella salina]|uniref:Uncharacterized protein n=1 Tax=Dunaliella salina TaxID=3046 RepID=A0ABQ7FTB6_DUNSA|nr:hypothetical protein DUNSADRAFT_9042 [Dunaliella salina]|eukprot:KAF5825520.1 hypothetical protein DUNSADRAFT_9042 [Dunaliella salina]